MADEEPDLGKLAKGWNAVRRGAAAAWGYYREVHAHAKQLTQDFRDGPKTGTTLKWYDRCFACFLGIIFFLCVVAASLSFIHPTLLNKILDVLKFAPLYLLIPLAILGILFTYLAACPHGSRLHHFDRGIQVIPLHIYLVVAWGGIILVPALLLWYMLNWAT